MRHVASTRHVRFAASGKPHHMLARLPRAHREHSTSHRTGVRSVPPPRSICCSPVLHGRLLADKENNIRFDVYPHNRKILYLNSIGCWNLLGFICRLFRGFLLHGFGCTPPSQQPKPFIIVSSRSIPVSILFIFCVCFFKPWHAILPFPRT